MKSWLKISLITLGIIAAIFLIYGIFFIDDPDVQAIKKKHDLEKKEYEMNLVKVTVEKEKLAREQGEIKKEMTILRFNYSKSESERLEWKSRFKREMEKKGKDEKRKDEKIKNENTPANCIDLVNNLKLELNLLSEGLEKTESSLFSCQSLNLKLSEEKINLEKQISLRDREIFLKENRINQLEIDYSILIKKKQPLFVWGPGGGLSFSSMTSGSKISVSIGIYAIVNINRLRIFRFR